MVFLRSSSVDYPGLVTILFYIDEAIVDLIPFPIDGLRDTGLSREFERDLLLRPNVAFFISGLNDFLYLMPTPIDVLDLGAS